MKRKIKHVHVQCQIVNNFNNINNETIISPLKPLNTEERPLHMIYVRIFCFIFR